MRSIIGLAGFALVIVTSPIAAQEPTRAHLIVSQNLMMLKTDRLQTIQQLRSIQFQENNVVVPAGQFLLAWPNHVVSGHMLAITEHGLIGYIPLNKPNESWYVEEERLREFAGRIRKKEAVSSVIVTKLTSIRPTPSSYFGDLTVGEFYIAKLIDEHNNYLIELSEGKRRQIARYRNIPFERTPKTVKLPSAAVQAVDLGRILPDGMTFDLDSTQLTRASEKKALFVLWPRIVEHGTSHKTCQSSEAISLSTSAGASAVINLGADAGGLIRWLNRLGVSLDLNGKIERSWKRIIDLPAGTEIRTSYFTAGTPAKPELLEIVMEYQCKEDKRAFLFPTEFGQFNMANIFQSLTDDWRNAFNLSAGRISVGCYNNYDQLRSAVINQMKQEKSIDFLLSRLAFVNSRNFFSPACGRN